MKHLFLCAQVFLLSSCVYQSPGPGPEWPNAFLGDLASPAAATKTIVIQPDTKWVNVTGGDTVKFIAGDKAFAWAFNVASNVRSFDLNRVAPPGMLNHRVVVYVAPDPRYIGGDGKGSNGSR